MIIKIIAIIHHYKITLLIICINNLKLMIILVFLIF